MFTRREFLQTLLIALALPSAAASRTGGGANAWARLVAIDGCPEGEAFCAADRGAVMRIDTDVGDVLQMLLSGDGERGVAIWHGLTRDSDYVLIRHALLERGAREVFSGNHIHGPAGWQHELCADGQTVERLAAVITPERESWAGSLAGCCRYFAGARTMSARRRVVTAAYPRPTGSAMQLRSWAFRA
jgi:hypothetical protein